MEGSGHKLIEVYYRIYLKELKETPENLPE
jgi:hypothetical protein